MAKIPNRIKNQILRSLTIFVEIIGTTFRMEGGRIQEDLALVERKLNRMKIPYSDLILKIDSLLVP